MVSTCMRREARLHRGVPAHLLSGHPSSPSRAFGGDALDLWGTTGTRDGRRGEQLHAGQGGGRSAGMRIYLYIYLYLHAGLDQVGGQHLGPELGVAHVDLRAVGDEGDLGEAGAAAAGRRARRSARRDGTDGTLQQGIYVRLRESTKRAVVVEHDVLRTAAQHALHCRTVAWWAVV